VQAKLGDVEPKVGDTLIVLADPGFAERWRDRSDFLLIARQGGAPPAVTRRAGLVGAVVLSIVLAAASGWLPVLHAALLGAVALVILRVLTPGEARAAVDLNVLVVIAASFGLGAAIEATGLAAAVGGGLAHGFGAWGRVGVVLGLVTATIVLTELITNNAAAALLFPIALAAAHDLGADPRTFAIAIALAASASFLTPIGYQTNTMVYGLGGYRFADYARLGAPVTLTTLVLLVVLL
jgi:di/tricarboxylate transporter